MATELGKDVRFEARLAVKAPKTFALSPAEELRTQKTVCSVCVCVCVYVSVCLSLLRFSLSAYFLWIALLVHVFSPYISLPPPPFRSRSRSA